MRDWLIFLALVVVAVGISHWSHRHTDRLHERFEDALVTIAIAMRDEGAEIVEIQAHIAVIRAHRTRDHIRGLWDEFRGRRDRA